jgi:hypothetical protein
LILLANINVAGGFYLWGSDLWGLMILFFFLYVGIFVLIEKIYRKYSKFESYTDKLNYISEKKKQIPKMTLDEFNEKIKSGRKLAIMDNYVLDMTSFMNFHPGGKFVLEYNIGRDIGKYISGAYVMENTTYKPLRFLHPHSHTKYAFSIIRDMIIATLSISNESSKSILPIFE